MVFQRPLEAMQQIDQYIGTWSANMRRAHLRYVDAGCLCQFKGDIETYHAQLEGIKSCYDEVLAYCVKTKADVNECAVELHDATQRYQELSRDHDRLEYRMLTQKRGLEMQRKGQELFNWHFLQAYKKKSVTTLVRISAGYGGAFRSKLEQRASRQFAAEFFKIEQELAEADACLRNVERRWQKARYLSSLVNDISAFIDRSKLSLDKFLVDQNALGLRRWEETLAYKKSRVASEGLRILICDSCNGWRWNDPKESLVLGRLSRPDEAVAAIN